MAKHGRLVQCGPKGSTMVNLTVFVHFEPIWTLLDHFKQNCFFCFDAPLELLQTLLCPFWGNKFIFVWNGQEWPKNVWEGEVVMILTYGLEHNLISSFDYWKARLDKCSLPLLAFVVPNSKLLSEHSKPTFPRNYTCWTRPQICIFKRRILHDKESVILAAFLQATESVKKRKELSEKFCFSKLSLQRCRLIFG